MDAEPVTKKVRLEVGVETSDEPPATNGDSAKPQPSISETAKNSSEETVEEELRNTLYLDTVDRARLDFDFEKLCSVSLSNVNVYACLTCGKYFQGRGKSSYAYFHSVDVDHHVFINLQTLRIYILPEGYEVQSKSLDDIKYVVDPWYTSQQISGLDTVAVESLDLSHRPYTPGFVGMNNIKENDYANVVIQVLAHVTPIRNSFLGETPSGKPSDSELLKRFGVLVRKIWNPKAFRAHVSPHELLQHVAILSHKRFTPIKQADPFAFLVWLLNQMHLALGGSKKPLPVSARRSTIIHNTFQGRINVQQQKVSGAQADRGTAHFEISEDVESFEVPFLCLSLDLPPAPLFQDHLEGGVVIPQVSLTSLLAKYDGVTVQELAGVRKRYKIVELPQILLLHIQRISKNKLSGQDERNPTVVSFPSLGLDMSPYVMEEPAQPRIYRLIANVVCEWTDSNRPRWRVQLLDKARGSWVQLENLIKEQVQRELLLLSESYIQVWEYVRQ